MQKLKIPLVAVALFSISLLIAFDYIVKPSYAQSISVIDFFNANSSNTVFYWDSFNKWVSLPNTQTTASSANPSVGSFITTDGETVTTTNFNINPVIGNQIDPNGNPCADSDGCPDAGSGWTGGTRALWCGVTYCYTLWNGANTAHQLIRFNSQGIINGYLNLTLADAIAPLLTGFDTDSQPQFESGIGSTTLFIWQEATGSTNINIHVIQGRLIMGIAQTSSAQVTPISQIYDMQAKYNFGGVEGQNSVVSVRRCVISTDGCSYNYNPNTNTLTLTSTLGQYATDGIGMEFDGEATITYLGDDIARWLLCGENTGSTTTLCFQASQTLSVGFDNTEITGVAMGDNLNVKSAFIDTETNMTYIYTSSSQNIAKVVIWNMTSYTKNGEVLSVDGGQELHSMAFNNDNPSILLQTESTSSRIILLEGFNPLAGQPTTACVDTNADGIADFCFPDTNGDGVPDSAGGLLNIGTPNQNVTSVAGTFGCGLGLSSCENLDIKTNGVGYILMLLMLVFFAGLIMFFAHKTNTPFNEIHIIFWVVLVLGVTGASYQLNFTDGIPFFATIVTIAGFSGLKMASYFKGG